MQGAGRLPVRAGRLLPPACLTIVLLAVPLLFEPFASEVRTAARKCGGKGVTILGTPGNDRIVGRGGSDTIYGDGGNDRILGGASGNDRICGGPGDDRIDGTKGNDRLYGEVGNDRLDGGPGSDRAIVGGPGRDRLLGGRGNDSAYGGGGSDYVDGGLGDDRVDGGPSGRDRVIGGHGSDRATGGAGNRDLVRGDLGRDDLDGGRGRRDVVSYASASSAVSVDLPRGVAKGDGRDRLSRFEDVVGSPFSGDSTGPAVIRSAGGGGASLAIRGSEGPEQLTIRFDGSRYTISSSSGFPVGTVRGCKAPVSWQVHCGKKVGLITIVAAGGDDSVVVHALPMTVRVRIEGGPGADSLRGGPGDDVIEAGDDGDPDLLVGGRGDDALIGARTDLPVPLGSGRSTMIGGGGSDVLVGGDPCNGDLYDGGAGADNANFFRFTPGVTAKIGGPARRAGEACTPGHVRSSVEAMEGTPGPDRLSGDRRRNTLSGGAGKDVLRGRGERDRLVGGSGGDRLIGGGGRDSTYQ